MSREQHLEALFAVIRAEARRNRRFALALDRALHAAGSRRARPKPQPALEPLATPEPEQAVALQCALVVHPVAMLRREGAPALREALGGFTESALRALLEEHNLDPAGAGEQEGAGALVERIVRAAEKRLERDLKLFAY